MIEKWQQESKCKHKGQHRKTEYIYVLDTASEIAGLLQRHQLQMSSPSNRCQYVLHPKAHYDFPPKMGTSYQTRICYPPRFWSELPSLWKYQRHSIWSKHHCPWHEINRLLLLSPKLLRLPPACTCETCASISKLRSRSYSTIPAPSCMAWLE